MVYLEKARGVERMGEKKAVNKIAVGAVAALLIVFALLVFFPNFMKIKTGAGAQAGDKVLFDFIEYYENGSVYQTTISDVAIDANIWEYGNPYRQVSIKLGGSTQFIQGIEEALYGMEKGENKTVVIPLEKAFGPRDPGKTAKVPKEYQVPRNQNASAVEFTAKFGEHEEGESVKLGFWNATILSKNNETVQLRSDPETGTEFQMPQLTIPYQNKTYYIEHVPANITDVTYKDFYFAPVLEEGKEYRAIEEETGEPKAVTFQGYEDYYAIFDFNHPLAGKNVSITLIVRDVEKNN